MSVLAVLSIVVPAYNEEQRLPSTLEAIFAYLDRSPYRDAEVIVVDDGSTDKTAAMVEARAATESRLRLLRNPGNRGKGYAVRNGMLEARGVWILFSDADLSAPIEELDKLMAAAHQRDAQIAIGSRAIDRSLVGVHQSLAREFSGRFFNVVMRLVTGLPFRDTQCGFKLFRADGVPEVFKRQQLDGFSFDVEDLYIAQERGLCCIEVPVRWNNVEGTKVSMAKALRTFSDLLVIRLHGLAGRYR
jgi:dolichyl-phosphate beta-glucosyltransferase